MKFISSKFFSFFVVVGFVFMVFLSTTGIFLAVNSREFITRVVEIQDFPTIAPLSKNTVKKMAEIKVDESLLFTLSLKEIEKRILSNKWIQSVKLEKKFPQTLSVSVKFREPKALLQLESDKLFYIDRDGVIFDVLEGGYLRDLPVFLGFSKSDQKPIQNAIQFIEEWSKSNLTKAASLSSVFWEKVKGFRATVSYQTKESNRIIRSTIELGSSLENDAKSNWGEIFTKLESVFIYLANHSIVAHQVFVGNGKKIVVKTDHGS